MFESITQEEVLKAIKALLKEDTLRKTTYAVWWHGTLISPSAVISKHYELIGQPINRNSFDTNQAQKILLQLGFPIVDTSREDGFFTETELHSFNKLTQNRFYDKLNPVDVNIGRFISNILWEKTKIWREKLLPLGWYKDNNKYNWQTQSSSKKGNNYKSYTWFKIFPDSNTKKLIFFTVGIGYDGSLEYKLDIQANNNFFTEQNRDWFYQERLRLGADMITIKKEKVHEENWDTLVTKTNTYFASQLYLLNSFSSHFWPEKRLMRIVWNTNNWQFPIKREWKKKWQGEKNKAHHEQYGFGFEEWLFNKRYVINGYQYGYIRGVETMPKNVTFINELHLYTLNSRTKEKLIIGKLLNVSIYHGVDELEDKVLEVFESHKSLMLEELRAIEADTTIVKKTQLIPNLSFKIGDAKIYEEPILVSNDLLKIDRFIPRIIEGDLDNILNKIEVACKDPKMNFSSGNATGTNSYSQNVTGGKRTVNKVHSYITNGLHDYLTQSTTYKNFEISTEKTRIGNNLVDCVAKNKDEYILFEAKTANSVLSCIRQALGQIIEYALLDASLTINKLIIVGPAIPDENDLVYLNNLKEKLKLPLEYWSYSFEEKQLNKRFKTY